MKRTQLSLYPQGIHATALSTDIAFGFLAGTVYESQHCGDDDGENDVVDNTYLCVFYFPG